MFHNLKIYDMDCLIEKINSSINVSLPYYNKVKLNVNKNGNFRITANNCILNSDTKDGFYDANNTFHSFPYLVNGFVTVKPGDEDSIENLFIENINNIKILNMSNCSFDNGTKDVSFLQMEKLSHLQIYETEVVLKWLKDNPYISELILGGANIVGNLADIKNTNISNLKIEKTNRVYGDIDVFANNEEITSLQLIQLHEMKGNIESLQNNLNLIELFVSNSIRISGDINVLAQNLFNNGKTSGSVKILASGTNCTNSNSLTSSLRVTISFNNSGYSMTNA